MTTTELTSRDRERHTIIRACTRGEITNAEASARLGLTIRQVQRLKRAVKAYGERGILHGNRGRAATNATDALSISRIIAFLKQRKHCDFGPTFTSEQLAKKNIILSRESVRAIMITHDLWKSKKRSGPAIHRAWRERMAMYGELVQFDGSYHDWYENGAEECLLAAIDDATGTVPRAVFDENEGVHAVFRFWWKYVETHGLPVAIYLDKFSTYKVNHKNAVDNAEMLTQFTRAMQELSVKLINANSPEAKGRIERLFGTLQDRLVKEMRLNDVKERPAANQFLSDEYLPEHNARFSVDARTEGNAHRVLSKELKERLPAIFSIQSERGVNNDFTIRFKNMWFQLSAVQDTAVYKTDTVTIEERLDGTMHVRLKETYLAYTALPERPERVRGRVTALTGERPRVVPPPGHPWRRAAAAEVERANRKRLRNAR